MSIEIKDLAALAKKNPLAVACALLMLILGVVYYFRMESMEVTQTTLDERAKILTKLKTNTAYAVNLDTHLKTLADTNRILRESALRVEQLAQNQQLFYRLESETGVRLLDLRQVTSASSDPKGAAASGMYKPVTFSLSVEGEYSKTILFLRRLEKGGVLRSSAGEGIPPLSRIVNALANTNTENVPVVNLTVEILGLR